MLNLIFGRSGSGKTEYVADILKSHARLGDNRLLHIVPEQFSFACERSAILSLGPKASQNIEVLSFTRLFDYVGRSLGGISGVVADDASKIIVMMRALEGIEGELTWYTKHVRSVPVAKELISLVGEFRREKVTPEMLECASKSTDSKTLSVKLHEFSLIYAAYDSLFSQTFIDDDTLLDRLCDTLRKNDFFKGYTICVDAFKGFTGQELEVLKYLIIQADEVYLTLPTPDPYAPDPSMVFGSVNDTAKRIISISKDSGVSVKKTVLETQGIRFKSEALKFLEENIFSPTDRRFEGVTEDITLITADNIHDECSYIAAMVRKLIRENGLRLNDIAVIMRHEDDYKYELTSALKRFDIPAFEDKRQPVVSQPLIVLCKSVLQIMIGGFTTENILHYLKSGLSPLTDIEVSKLENYALMWNLGAKAWQTDFTNSPNGLDELKSERDIERNEKDLQRLNEMRAKIIGPLISLKKSIKDTTALEISTSLYKFLTVTKVPQALKNFAISLDEDGYSQLASEQNRVWEILMELLSKMGTVYGDSSTSVNTFAGLFNAVLSVTDLGTIPHTLDEVQIGSADRIRLSNPRVVFVAGCEEGIFPSTVSSSGLLSLSDRKSLASLGISLSVESSLKACEERFIAYSALTMAREKVFISYHRTDGTGGSYTPSVIFTNTEELFEDHCISVDTSDLYADFFAETRSSAFTSYAENYYILKSNDEDNCLRLNSMRSLLNEDKSLDGRLRALDDAANRKPFKIEDKNTATELFGKDLHLSASRVEVFGKCPFEYFCKHGINAKPRRIADLAPNISGTVVHYVLENIIKEYGKDGLLSLSGEDKKQAVYRWLSVYLNEKLGGFNDKTLRFKYLYSRISISLLDVVNRLCEEFQNTEFTPCDFELSIGNGDNSDIPAYTLELDDGGKLEIIGSVDRVDKYEKDGTTYIRVVDYKSGGKTFVLSDILYGLNLQMLIYMFAIEAGGKERYGNIIPAGVLYYTAKRSSVSQSKKYADKAETEKEKRSKDCSNGLFLSSEVVLNAMEKDIRGVYIPVKAKELKDGTTSLEGNLITAEQMGRLRSRIDDSLRKMAFDLHNGEINALPAFGVDYKYVCDYCDYKTVCRVEDGEKREIEKLKHKDAIELLNGGDGNA